MTRVFVVAIAVLLVTSTSEAKPYPVNACVAAKQKASGRYCAAVLDAEGTFIKDLSQDPQGTERDAAEAKARTKFDATFGRQATCPTQASETTIESAVDAIVADLVRDTTVSPNVADTQFTEYSPTGTIDYLGK